MSDNIVLRAAAFARVAKLREKYSGRIPRAELSEHVVAAGKEFPIWNYQKGIFKPAAFGPDGAALSIQTSIGSPYADVQDAGAGEIAYKYRGDDPNHPDNVALRRAMVDRQPLIYLIGVDPGYYDAILPVYVTGDNPAALQFTMAVDQSAMAFDSAADSERTALRREYTTRTVLQRLHQQRFRRMVLAAYNDRCCICRLTHLELLDAAHILPDKHPMGEPVITNGLGLCKIHHSAFDANIIGIDPAARVHVREDILREKDGPMLRHGLQEMAGAKLVLPRRIELRPNADFLAERFELFTAA